MEELNLTGLFATITPSEEKKGKKSQHMAQKIARADQDFEEMMKIRHALEKAFAALPKKKAGKKKKNSKLNQNL